MIGTSEQIHPEKSAGLEVTAGTSDLGGLISHTMKDDGTFYVTYQGLSVMVQFLEHGVVRLYASRQHEGPVPASTIAIASPSVGSQTFEIRESGDSVDCVGRHAAVVFRRDRPGWKVYRNSNEPSNELSTATELGTEFYELLDMQTDGERCLTAHHRKHLDDQFYGLGEKTGFLNKQGERYEMWNSDVFDPHVPDMEALYVSIPFAIHVVKGDAYGLFLDNPGRMAFDMRTESDAYTTHAADGHLDCYIIPGPNLKDVLRHYTALTGRMPMPALWALGYHQSRYSYMNQAEVLDLARTFREKRIPCDVIHLDIHYMRGYRVFTFDPDAFPDAKAMMAELNELGFKVVTIVDPGVKHDSDYAPFAEGLEKRLFCTYDDGTLYTGEVWPGDAAFPDFTDERAAAWWGDKHAFYTELGVRGIWNDMNEPSVFNTPTKTMDSTVMHKGDGGRRTHEELHNEYGFLMSKATYEGVRKHLNGLRPFVLSRSGYAGVQRYSAIWTGDNRSYWEHMAMSIPMLLNLGLSGVSFAGSDIGGFSHHTSGELLARWTQLGSFLPFARNHSCLGTARQEPWAFGPEIEEICRRYIGLRYQWLPHLYSLFYEASQTGIPIIRPLVMEYPNDPRTFNLCDEFLLGSTVLVAPVIRPGDLEKLVYLPEGTWLNFWTREVIEGGRSMIANAPLDTLPVYIKAGSLIAQTAEMQHTEEYPTTLRFDVYLGGRETATYPFYEDDGNSFKYEQGEYNVIDFSLEESETGFEIHWSRRHDGYDSPCVEWTFRFLNVPVVGRINVEGATHSVWAHDAASRQVSITVAPTPAGSLRVRYLG